MNANKIKMRICTIELLFEDVMNDNLLATIMKKSITFFPKMHKKYSTIITRLSHDRSKIIISRATCDKIVTMSYKIRLNVFEGPFDLLVYLIERAEMSIYDIQISIITRQYLDHIRMMEESDVAASSEFMVLAATLIDIKSKMLLPRINEDGTESEDPRTDLSKKLIEYVRFKKAAAALESQREVAKLKLQKPQEDLLAFTGEPDIYLRMEMESFINAFKGFIHRRVKGEELLRFSRNIERERLSLEKKVSFIGKLMAAARKAKQKFLSFRDLLSKEPTRADRVVTLVALLDMASDGSLKVKQTSNFGEIEISPSAEERIGIK